MSFWGNLTEQVATSGTPVGRLVDMFVETDEEKFRKGQRKFLIEQQNAQRESWKQRNEEHQIIMEARKENLKNAQSRSIYTKERAQDDLIKSHEAAAANSVMQRVMSNPKLDTLNDAQKKDLLNSPEARDYTQFLGVGRIALKAYNEPNEAKKGMWMGALNKTLGTNGFSVKKVGEDYYLQGENTPAIKLNETTFTQLHNFAAQNFGNEINARILMEKGKGTLYGNAHASAIRELMMLLPEENKNSVQAATKNFQLLFKENGWTKADMNVYAIRQNIKSFYSDGRLDNNEKAQLMQNLAILADMKGIKYEMGANGEPLVIAADGARIPLKQAADMLQGEDRIGNYFEALTNEKEQSYSRELTPLKSITANYRKALKRVK